MIRAVAVTDAEHVRAADDPAPIAGKRDMDTPAVIPARSQRVIEEVTA
ncbi:hypothetical protein [Streptomyces sp. NPDC058964]